MGVAPLNKGAYTSGFPYLSSHMTDYTVLIVNVLLSAALRSGLNATASH